MIEKANDVQRAAVGDSAKIRSKSEAERVKRERVEDDEKYKAEAEIK